ncbi:hypothetical protein NBJODN_NBJODN_06820, partial [Dysosmobacter welbionis]
EALRADRIPGNAVQSQGAHRHHHKRPPPEALPLQAAARCRKSR